MRLLWVLAITAPLFAGELERFTDSSLNYTQRNTACLALRGDRSEETAAAMRMALSNVSLQACAAQNLRIAGAGALLAEALETGDPSARAVAARELGVLQEQRYLPLLIKAAADPDLMIASNAIEGLVRYEDHSSAPALRELALAGGVMTSLAVDALLEWHDAEALAVGRKLMSRREPGDRLVGVRVVGLLGDSRDMEALRKLASDDIQLGQTSRGFGLMPAISMARAARTAMESIQQRQTLKP